MSCVLCSVSVPPWQFSFTAKEKLFLVFFVPLWFKAFKQKKDTHKFDAKDQFCGCPVLFFMEFAGADFVSSSPCCLLKLYLKSRKTREEIKPPKQVLVLV